MQTEDTSKDSYLNYLLKKQSQLQTKTDQRTIEVDYNKYVAKKIDMKKLRESKKKSYKPQNKHVVGPLKPSYHDPTKAAFKTIDNESDSDSEDLELYKEINFEEKNIPLTHETVFQGHSRTICDCTIDRSGTRMVTSGNDSIMKFWDFPNMTVSRKCFRSLDPLPGQPPKTIDFNFSGSKILVSGGNAKPKVLNRDGRIEFEFVKGDMYIRDHSHTKGHIGVVTSSEWHPNQHNLIITGSLDSTVRIWDVNMNKIGIEQQLPSKTVIKLKNKKGMKTGAWQTKLSPDGSKILVACQDGSYQVFCGRNRFTRPVHLCRTPYNCEITSLDFFEDNMRFVSRGQDNTMRLFDLRKFERPVYSWYELENNHEKTAVVVSPDQKYLLTGTSNTKTVPGCLVITDVQSCEELTRIPLSIDGKVTCINWNKKLNQIFVGAGKIVKAFFNPKISNNGVILSLSRKDKEWKPDHYQYQRPIFTPHALPLFNNDDRFKRDTREKFRTLEPELSNKPELPLTGPGRGGKVAGATTITQHLMRTVHQVDHSKREDPIEALRRQQEDAEKNPEFINHAYKNTQPVNILDYESEIHDEQKLMSRHKKCPKCGLKMCHCMKNKF